MTFLLRTVQSFPADTNCNPRGGGVSFATPARKRTKKWTNNRIATTQNKRTTDSNCFLSATVDSTQRQPQPEVFPNQNTTTSISSSSSSNNICRRVREEHEEEMFVGFDTFRRDDREEHSNTKRRWEENEFECHSVGGGNAGPDEHNIPENGAAIFETIHPVFTKDQCEHLLEEARSLITSTRALEQRQQQHSSTEKDRNERTNSQLGEARLSNLVRSKVWLQDELTTTLFPLLEDRFGIPSHEFTLYDALVIGHIAPSRSQPLHRDASILSLNIALSPSSSYTGGGTYFEALDDTLHIPQGHALSHAGGSMHAGMGISTGERWVLVLFVLAKSHVQYARRLHRLGVDALDNNHFDSAEAHFLQGLQHAPDDHLLHRSLGNLYMARDETSRAMECFIAASKAYPLCTVSPMTLGRIHLQNRRPRAALRCFDTVLRTHHEMDIQDWIPSLRATAWDANVLAARCAVLCAEYESHQQQQLLDRSSIEKDTPMMAWSREQLPRAIDRIHMALVPAPEDGRLIGLLARAQELLNQADACQV